MLRLLRHAPLADAPPPLVLGVDDFSIRKGRTYATILIDLQRHRIVDLLPDREAQTLQAWLAAHPGVEVISRDRAGAYAQGARKGAPQAQQVTDRLHLLLNLQEALKRMFERKHEQRKHLTAWEPAKEERTSQAQEARAQSMPEPVQPISSGPKLSPVHEARRQLRREKRKKRYDEVLQLHELGVSQVAIATLLGLDRNTVHRYITAPAFPEILRPKRASVLDPSKQYLLERWAPGQCTASSLLAELRERGYRGGETLVYDYLRPVRGRPEWMQAYQQQKALQAQGKRLVPLSAREGAWLFICNPRKLTLRQVQELEPLRRIVINVFHVTHYFQCGNVPRDLKSSRTYPSGAVKSAMRANPAG